MNISVQVCVCTCFISLGCIPIVKLQNHINISILNLLNSCHSIFQVPACFTFSSKCMQEFQFSIILTNTCYFCLVLNLYKLKFYPFFFFFFAFFGLISFHFFPPVAGVQPQLIQGVRSGDSVGEGQDTIASIRY